MNKNEALEALKDYEIKSFALNHATGLLYFDSVTYGPKGCKENLPITMAELSKIKYDLTTAPETVEMLETLNKVKDELDPVKSKEISELYRNYSRTKMVPRDEFAEYQKLISESEAVWNEAKNTDNYAIFEPYLQKVFDMTNKMALYYDSEKDPYDTMLDMYERGLTQERCDKFFSALKESLVPLIKKVVNAEKKIDNSLLLKPYSIEKQKELSEFLVDRLHIDRNYFTVAETEHPFTTEFSKKDVRITTHYYENDIMNNAYSIMHEGGHALYELHTGDNLMFTCLAGGVSMGIHESQSRFYENIVGKSKEFTAIMLRELKNLFPEDFGDVSEQSFYEMVNSSAPSLIRLFADELTYCMHIIIRYELEKKMVHGEITAKELPAEWNRLYKEYLGVDVPNYSDGVLQDDHWSGGGIGYFPSYAIGSAYGAQYLMEMNKDFDVKKAIAEDKIYMINDWLEEKIWKYGGLIDPLDLFNKVCGEFNPQYYIDYLTEKFTEIYELK